MNCTKNATKLPLSDKTEEAILGAFRHRSQAGDEQKLPFSFYSAAVKRCLRSRRCPDFNLLDKEKHNSWGEAQQLGIHRQAAIKVWLPERLKAARAIENRLAT